MNIIEKLGIKSIERKYNKKIWNTVFSQDEVTEVEQQRNDLLETFIDVMDSIIGVDDKGIVIYTEDMDMCKIQSVIEKVCYPKKWEEIKELSNA